MMNTLILHTNLSKLSKKQLDDILSNETVSFFQTQEAIRFFETMGIETFSFAIEVDQKIMALVSGIIQKEKGLRSTFTKRAIIYGGPVISENATVDHVSELFRIVKKRLRNSAIYIETRNLHDYSAYKTAVEKVGFEYHPHLNFHVDCSIEDEARKRLSKSKLRQIKKSIKEGAEAKEAATISEVEQFYYILKNLYKTKVKTPLPEVDFFAALWEQKLAKFFLVFFNNKVVGGIVCPFVTHKVIYEWYVCGEDRVHKNVYPSILATWKAIEYACHHNMARFDFMGAGKPDDDYGVREFKSKFGGELVEHGRFIHIVNPLLYNLGKKAVSVLKKM